MRKLMAALIVISILFSAASAFALNKKDEAQLQKTQILMNKAGEAPADEDPAPADQAPSGTPTAPSIPTPEDPSAPIDAKVSQYYCVIANDQVKNLETLCEKYNAPMSVYRSFNQLVVFKRLGVLVKVNPKDTYFIGQLRKLYSAKPLRKVSLKVSVSVSSLAHNVNNSAEGALKNEFEPSEEILTAMLKTPYGRNNTMFKNIARAFPGLLDKVTVKINEYLGLGKKRKMLFNPIVTIELTALNMNGKNKHVTMFYQQFAYKTIKHDDSYQWGK